MIIKIINTFFIKIFYETLLIYNNYKISDTSNKFKNSKIACRFLIYDFIFYFFDTSNK